MGFLLLQLDPIQDLLWDEAWGKDINPFYSPFASVSSSEYAASITFLVLFTYREVFQARLLSMNLTLMESPLMFGFGQRYPKYVINLRGEFDNPFIAT